MTTIEILGQLRDELLKQRTEMQKCMDTAWKLHIPVPKEVTAHMAKKILQINALDKAIVCLKKQ